MNLTNDLVSLEEAVRLVFEHQVSAGLEHLPIEQCLGRVLAQDITARVTVPPFDASAMDGYAVRFEDVTTIGSKLSLIGEVAAGQPNPFALEPNQTVRVFTGTPMPRGADHVLIQEQAVLKNGEVTVSERQEQPRHIRRAGGDFSEGDLVLRAGTVLTPSHMGLSAAANYKQLHVRRKPSIAILISGSELRPPGSQLSPGQIIESNSYTLSSILSALGATTTKLDVVRDDQSSIEQCFTSAASADMILAIGGASVGKHDLVRAAFQNTGGEFLFERIAVRPGKPTWFGKIGDQPVLGLPGNPTAAFVIASLLMKPLLGLSKSIEFTDALLKVPLSENGPRETYARGHYSLDNGIVCVAPLSDQDTSRVNVLASTNCFIHRPPHDPGRSENQKIQIVMLN